MSYTTKRKILNSTVYIVLGLVITAVICVTIATFAGMRNNRTTRPLETKPAPAGVFSPSPDVPPASETPAPASDTPAPPQTSSSPDNGETPAIEPVKPVYCLPADGAVQKEYSPSQPVRSLTMNDYRTHDGVDISAPAGSPVAAFADGVVLETYSDPMMGMCLSIDHGNGLVSTYKNLSSCAAQASKPAKPSGPSAIPPSSSSPKPNTSTSK